MLKMTLLSMRSLNWKAALKKMRWIVVVLIIGLPIMAHEAYATIGYLREQIIVSSLVIQPDGRILVGGKARNSDDSYNFLVRLNDDGSLDTTFERNMSGRVEDIVVQADGKILVGGGFHHLEEIIEDHIHSLDYIFSLEGIDKVLGLARLNADGSLDTTFKPWTDNLIKPLSSSIRCCSPFSDLPRQIPELFSRVTGIGSNPEI